jgi:hypothetical protein
MPVAYLPGLSKSLFETLASSPHTPHLPSVRKELIVEVLQ